MEVLIFNLKPFFPGQRRVLLLVKNINNIPTPSFTVLIAKVPVIAMGVFCVFKSNSVELKPDSEIDGDESVRRRIGTEPVIGVRILKTSAIITQVTENSCGWK